MDVSVVTGISFASRANPMSPKMGDGHPEFFYGVHFVLLFVFLILLNR